MIIFPAENPANRFVHTPKALHEDNTMSWKAKGMIAWMSSHSENYQLHMSVLLKISSEGRDSVYSGLKEICNSPYGRKIRYQNNKGHIKYHYAISVTPHSDEEWDSFISQIDWESMDVKRTSVRIGDSPICGKSSYGSPAYGEPQPKIYKENKSNKKKRDIVTSEKSENDVVQDTFKHWWDLFPSSRRSDKQGCFNKWKLLCKKLSEDEIISLVDTISIDIVKRIEACGDLEYYPRTPAYLQKKRWEDG